MLFLWFSIISFIALSCSSSTVGHDNTFIPDYVLNITQINVPIGCKNRLSIVANGTVPGPPIVMKENQTTWVRVYNGMADQSLTTHWHGLSQSVAPFSDGTPRVSQWPIPPLHFFDYEVHPQLGEAGTYFYHSHVGFQAVTAAGPLIVEEASGSPPYPYDEEKTFFFSELYNKTENELVNGLTTDSNNTYFWTGETEAILLNGNAANSSNAEESEACGTAPDSGPPCNDPIFSQNSQPSACAPAVITVEPDKQYRIRTIGGMAISLYTFGFEDHDNLTVIAADGSYTQPLEVENMQVGAGQRYDFLLETKSSSELQQLNKSTFLIQQEVRQRGINVRNYAILQYNLGSGPEPDYSALAQPSTAPLSLPDDVWNWPADSGLSPLEVNERAPSLGEVTRRIYLSNHQISSQQVGIDWTVSNNTWSATSPDTPPYLVSIYQNGETAIPSLERANAYGGWDPEFNAYPAEIGETLEIVLVNENNGLSGGLDSHPWHIHGQHIWDVGAGSGTYDAEANEARLVGSGRAPAKRDTTWVWKYTDGDDLQFADRTKVGWRAWRVRLENAGVWMVHCHTLQHMIMGMQTVWVIGNASEIVGKGLEESTGYLDYGGSVYGNDTYAPNVTHFWEDGQCCIG